MRRVLAVAALVPLMIACTRIPPTTPYTEQAGINFCRELNRKANDRAVEEFLLGTTAAVTGSVLFASGIVLSSFGASDAAWYERSQPLFLMVPGAVLTAMGVGSALASGDSDRLAKQSQGAIMQKPFDDRAAYYECVAARGNWANDTGDITRLQLELFKENRAAASAASDAARAATMRVEAADETAKAAQKSANRALEAAAGANNAAMTSVAASRDLASGTEQLVSGVAPKKDGAHVVEGAKTSIAEARKKLEGGGAIRAPQTAPSQAAPR